MPLIANHGSFTTGHCWPAVRLEATTVQTVFIGRAGGLGVDGGGIVPLAVIVPGDTTATGKHGGTCGDSSDHEVVVKVGFNNKVFAEGKPITLNGDSTECGDVVKVTGGSVYANGGPLAFSPTPPQPFVPPNRPQGPAPF